jgi:hypothetical protein
MGLAGIIPRLRRIKVAAAGILLRLLMRPAAVVATRAAAEEQSRPVLLQLGTNKLQ